MVSYLSKTIKIFTVVGILAIFLAGNAIAEKIVEIDKVDEKPQLVLKKAPVYPEIAKSIGLKGNVLLRLNIGSDGGVNNIEVISSEPEGVFDKAAIDAVSKWRFKPASLGGEHVATSVNIPLKFEI